MSDGFGTSVAISGTWVVVGTPCDNVGELDVGSVHVYNLASVTPAMPVLTLTNPSPAAADFFGFSVAISGTRVVVGAHYDDTDAENAGSAYVYDLAGVDPAVPVARLAKPAPKAEEWFGHSVRISGMRVVVGVPLDDIGAVDSGSAYVYDLSSATPSQPVATLTNPSPAFIDRFGWSVAIAGTRVVIGTPYDDTSAFDTGSAYVYDLASATPTVSVATLHHPSPANFHQFGLEVAMDGSSIVVGAPFDDTNARDRGAAYIFSSEPRLRIVPAAPGLATISWTPATSSGYVLQYADSLAPVNWVNASSGALNPVTVPLTNAARFYRLIQP
jgi:hypothetical protein